MTHDVSHPSDDMLHGVEEIAEHLGESKRRANYLCERGQIPAFKMPGGRRWYMRKSTYQKHLAHLEQAGLAPTQHAV